MSKLTTIGRCESSGCIDIDELDGHIRIRSTVTGTVMQCTAQEWCAFLADLAAGRWAHIGQSEQVTA